MTDPPSPPPPPAIAYCAPGRQLLTALYLMLRGEHADRIEETPHLTGNTILLIPGTPPRWPV